jgi:hypothetical protein
LGIERGFLILPLLGTYFLLIPKFTNHWAVLSVLLSGLQIGATLVAMNIGHWYLSATHMSMRPLQSAIRWIFILLGFRLLVYFCLSIFILWNSKMQAPVISLFSIDYFESWIAFPIRILFGWLGPVLLTWMNWETVKIESTQSATGILYSLLTLTLVGEAAGIFLTLQMQLPL